jgi:hypothetical protein
MSSISIDYIVYCREFGWNTTLVVVSGGGGARDTFHPEDLVLVVDLSDLGYFAVVPPVLVSFKREGPRSSRCGRKGSLHGFKADPFGNRKPSIYLKQNACAGLVRITVQ